MRPRYAALLLAALAPCAWAGSCSDPVEIQIGPTGGSGGDFVGDAGNLDASDAAGGAPPFGDGGPPAPVYAALASLPKSGEPGGPGSFEAELAAFALGARAAIIERSFRELCDATGAPDGAAVSALAAVVEQHAAAGRKTYVEVAAARRSLDLRPDALTALAWDDPLVSATWVSLAEALLMAAPSTGALGLGSSVDVLLELEPTFATFALSARAELTQLPAPPRLALGFRAGALVAGSLPDQPRSPTLMLASSFELVRLTYLPGVDPAPASPLELADALFTALPEHTFLLEAGTAGGTPAEQATFHALLRTLVTTHRAQFPLLHLVQLADLAAPGCASYAAWSGLDPASDAAASLCASGVLDSSGAPKPALSELLVTLATLASP